MIKSSRGKRTLSISLLVLGGLLIFLAPENVWIGSILLISGLCIEVVGLVLSHRR